MTAGTFPYDPALAEQLDPTQAMRLLEVLGEPGQPVHLQVFADGPHELYYAEQFTRKDGSTGAALKYKVTGWPKTGGKTTVRTGGVTTTRNTTLEDLPEVLGQLLAANFARCGLFFAVNVLEAGEKTRRSNDTVTQVRALFVDLDGAPLPTSWPIEPTAILESSPGRFHVYWAAADVPLNRFTAAQQHLARLFGGDVAVCDLARVMRLPGMAHNKADTPFVSQLLQAQALTYTFEELTAAFDLAPVFATQDAADAARLEAANESRARAEALRAELSSGTAGDQTAARQKYAQAALLDEVAAVATAGQGGRNNQLNNSAFKLGTLAATGLLEVGDIRAELARAAESVGLGQHEASSTIESGLAAGLLKPRDLSKVGALAGKKKAKPKKDKPSSPALSAKAQAVAAEGESLPSADELPGPEGEGYSYSDAQVLEFLGLPWPVVAADTDKAHAHRLHAVAGDNLGFVPELGGYVAWNGQQWLSGGKDGPGQTEARRYVQRLGLAMKPETDKLLALYGVLAIDYAETLAEYGEDDKRTHAAKRRADAMRKAYFRHVGAAKSTEGDKKQQAILSSARTLYPKSIKDFEPRPWVVGFPNGTWDKGTFRPAQRTDHMLTLAAVAYDPTADRSAWLEVLARITGGDAELARTLQDVAGYALSGASSLRLLPWLYGEGGTGKSTFSELLATLLGDLAATIDPKLFASDAARERLGAAIWGKRVALCAEAGNARLDAEALKTLSGGDRLSVRMLYSEGFTARASHVLLMVANDPPRVDAYDDALKDRVLALPFTHRLDSGPQLLGGQRLEQVRQDAGSALAKGFTAWAVEGLERVYKEGDIYRAPVCKAATRAFWGKVDPLAEFWEVLNPSALAVDGVPVAEMRDAYEKWAESNGQRPMTAQRFSKAADSVGLEKKNIKNVKTWKLTRPERYPLENTEIPKTTQFPQTFTNKPPREGGSKEFRENDPISVFRYSETPEATEPTASGWEGEKL